MDIKFFICSASFQRLEEGQYVNILWSLLLSLLLTACAEPESHRVNQIDSSFGRSGCLDFVGQRLEIPFTESGGVAQIGGDILLPMSQIFDCGSKSNLGLASPSQSDIYWTFLWRKKRVPYALPADFPYTSELNFAISEWAKSGIKWEPKTSIDIDFVNFVLLDPSDPKMNNDCGNSYLGRIGGGQSLNLRTQRTNGTCGPIMNYVLLHEMGHAIGFLHEHQRSDRDNFIKFSFDTTASSNLSKVNGSRHHTDFDLNSVMIYSTAQIPGMTTLNGSPIPQNQVLSSRDIQGVGALYAKPPYFYRPADMKTMEDTPITFAIGVEDLNTLSCTSTHWSYSSSDTKLVAATQGVRWSGTWPSCTSTVTPVPNANGTVALTYTLSDGSLNASRTFTLAFQAVNDPPSIESLSSQSTTVDTVKTLPMTVSDPEGVLECSNTYLRYSSSNPSVVAPSGAVVWSGIWPTCTATVTPVARATGYTELTFIVSDGTLQSSSSFLLSVSNPNEDPLFQVLSKERSVIAGERSEISLDLRSVVDTSAPASCSSLISISSDAPDVLPAGSISIEGDAPNCKLVFAPPPNARISSRLSLGVKVGSQMVSQILTLNIGEIAASITTSKLRGKAPFWLNFSGSDSKSANNQKIVSWEWDFGDGTKGKAMNFSKSYTIPGEYEIRLKVLDASGKQDVEKVKIVVEN
ncbi:MAG: hypothetical protein RIR26_1940 [Pseudomonadota bacterium]|jgi:hypothetical protein